MAACSRRQRGDLYQIPSSSSRTRIPPPQDMLNPFHHHHQQQQQPTISTNLQPIHDNDHRNDDGPHFSSSPSGLSSIGRPIHFSLGQFTGYTIRMELYEVQKADLGRKYARVDRRPLDPPPVIHLRIFEVQHVGTPAERETELEYDDIQVLGLICTVDLFPVPDAFAPSQATSSKTAAATGAGGRAPPPILPGSGPIFTSPSPPSTSSTQSYEDHQHHTGRVEESSPSSSTSSGGGGLYHHHHHHHQHHQQHQPQVSPSEWQHHPSSSTSSPQLSGNIFPSQANNNNTNNNVVHRLGNFPISENSKRTQMLAGTTFVQAVLVEFRGKKAVMFAFSDLAVKIEGAFILRYRVFDLFSRSYEQNNNEAIVTAEAYGGPFRVYSTKDFPGLRASTELTKNLARWGVRLNIREAERRRRKRSDNGASPPSSPTTNFAYPD